MKSAEDYLEKHQVQARVQDAVNSVLATMPADPMAAIAAVLAPAPKGGAAAPKKEGGEKKEGDKKEGEKEGKKEAGKKQDKKEGKKEAKSAPSPEKAAAAPSEPAAQVGHSRIRSRVTEHGHACVAQHDHALPIDGNGFWIASKMSMRVATACRRCVAPRTFRSYSGVCPQVSHWAAPFLLAVVRCARVTEPSYLTEF